MNELLVARERPIKEVLGSGGAVGCSMVPRLYLQTCMLFTAKLNLRFSNEKEKRFNKIQYKITINTVGDVVAQWLVRQTWDLNDESSSSGRCSQVVFIHPGV